MPTRELKFKTNNLFYGKGRHSVLFNRFLLAANIAAIFLFLMEPLYPKGMAVRAVEIFFGVFFLAEYSLRFWVAERRFAFVFSLVNLLDLIVVTSLFAPLLFGNFAFLRVIRSLRILRTYRLIVSLKGEKNWFAKNEDVVLSTLNLFVFVFIMTDIVYVLEGSNNENITSYVDALYFTLATLTTTGFGDITLHGPTGKLLSIFIMVFGITLFVKLGRDVLRPSRVHYTCPDCGLNLHDFDAVHCKHCGRVVKIVTEGI